MLPPDLGAIEEIAREALASIPRELRRHTEGVLIRVEDFPDPEIEKDMELESPFDLLGLYRGTALGWKGQDALPDDVDMIILYRRPILDYWCESEDDLKHVIRHVLIHEIGHHFGLSDADMERIERDA